MRNVFYQTTIGSLFALSLGCGVCGDAKVSRSEECDDGNDTLGDGCRQDCVQEKCDDGIIDKNELCGFPENRRLTGVNPVALSAGDFNGDGNPDLIAVDASADSFQFLLNDGFGTFLNNLPVVVGDGPNAIDAGDLDRDGFLDLAISNQASGDVSVLFGLGNGTFEAPITLVAQLDPSGVAIGDADGDADLDIAVSSSSQITASLFLRESGNTFTKLDLTVGSIQSDVAMLDIDGDNEQEPLFAVGASIIITQAALAVAPIPVAATRITAGDLNQDGTDDMIASQNALTVVLGLGDGIFSAAQTLLAGQTPGEVALADIDNDGLLDLASANTNSDDATVFASDIAGSFVSQGQTTTSGCLGVSSIAAADFNSDGVVDVALACSGSAEVRILLTKP
jgi:cysteine-rich repeat protein